MLVPATAEAWEAFIKLISAPFAPTPKFDHLFARKSRF